MIAIDPGKHSPGFACFDDDSKEMWKCGHEMDFDRLNLTRHEHIVIEKPMIYPRSPVDPNHIITLALSAGFYAGKLADSDFDKIEWVLPRQWKGQIPKTKALKNYIVYKRVVAHLNAFENAELERALKAAPSAAFDIVDAVGIGLYALGRM